MRTHTDIIEAAGASTLHERMGISLHTVRSWRQRGSIPPEYWPALEKLGVATSGELLAARPPRKRKAAA